MVQEQWLQLKIKFLLRYNMKIVIKWGGGGGGEPMAVAYPEFFWAAQYTHQIYDNVTMVGTEGKNFQSLFI